MHNERGHDSIEAKNYEGKTVFNCTLYPGLTCQQHTDAAVDVDAPRDEFLVKLPFITLCPNSWLVPPTGTPVQISEADQFVPAKVQKAVGGMQKTLGNALSVEVYLRVRNALHSFDSDLEDENFEKALRSLAGVETLVKKPHKALLELLATRLQDLDDEVRWAYEDAIEVGAKDDTPAAQRVALVRTLAASVGKSIYGKRLPIFKTMSAWLEDK